MEWHFIFVCILWMWLSFELQIDRLIQYTCSFNHFMQMHKHIHFHLLLLQMRFFSLVFGMSLLVLFHWIKKVDLYFFCIYFQLINRFFLLSTRRRHFLHHLKYKKKKKKNKNGKANTVHNKLSKLVIVLWCAIWNEHWNNRSK